MLYPVVFFISISVLTVMLYIIDAQLTLEYVSNGRDDHTAVSVSILGGLLKYKKELSEIEPKEPVKEQADMEKEKAEKGTFYKYFDKYTHFKTIYASIKLVGLYLRDKLYLKDFYLEISVGTGEAFFTGIAAGALWTAAGSLLSFLTNNFRTVGKSFNKHVNVKTDYTQKKFETDFHCIFITKIVYIIVVGLKFLFEYFRKKLKKHRTGGGNNG